MLHRKDNLGLSAHVNSIELRHLRLVSFKFLWVWSLRHINLDLSRNDASEWVVFARYSMMHTFSCPEYKKPTLVEWREKYIDEGKVAQAETMGTLVDRGTSAMKVFKQICDQKVYMYATLDAILHLAMDLATLLSKNDNGESGFLYRNEKEKDKDLDYDKDETKNGCPADNCMLVELGPQLSTKLSHVALFKHTFSQELHFSSWPS